MPKFRQIKAVHIVLLGVLAALVLAVICLSCVPPTSRDALAHHLAVPKLYLKHGGIYEIPAIRFSYYPMNLDLLYLIPLYFGNDIIPKFIHFFFALMTAVLIFRYLKSRLSTTYALFGVLMFLSVPIIVNLSIQVYVDLGLVFFTFASLYYILKWIETNFRIRYLLISSVFCGLALGTKYNGLVFLFLATLIVIFVYERKRRRLDDSSETAQARGIKAVAFGALFCCLALIVFSPWMIKNYVWTKNPVFPLYDGFFNPNAGNDSGESESLPVGDQRPLDHLVKRHILLNESFLEIVFIPVRIFFQGKDDDWRHFDGKLNPFLFILPFFAFSKIRREDSTTQIEKRIFLAFAILYVLFAFLSTVIRIRYVAPVIPPLVILSVFGMREIFAYAQKKTSVIPFISGCAIVIACLPLIMNAAYVVELFQKVDPAAYISGQISRDDYIAKRRPVYSTFLYVNRNLPDDAKILGLFLSERGYHCDRDIIYDESVLKKIIKNADSPDMILSGLKDQGITHLIVRQDQFQAWVNMGTHFDEKDRNRLHHFFKNLLIPLFSEGGYALYGLS